QPWSWLRRRNIVCLSFLMAIVCGRLLKKRYTMGRSSTTGGFPPRILSVQNRRRVQLVSSSLADDSAGTRSQTTLIETRIGTANKAPGTPQSHVQKISE